MDRLTGGALVGPAHLAQSIRDILTTPLGSRVGRRAYGSEVPRLIDQPQNAVTRLRLYAATVGALIKWEPRLATARVSLDRDPAGTPVLLIDGVDRSAPAGRGRVAASIAFAVGADPFDPDVPSLDFSDPANSQYL